MTHSFPSRLGLRSLINSLLIVLSLALSWQTVLAASSWNPTLLVNTESFETLDEGDGTTDIELRFGGTLNEKLLWNRSKGVFQFTDDLSVVGILSGSTLRIDGNADVHGALTASGAVRTDSNLTLNDDQTAADAILTFGQPSTNQTLKYLNTSGKFQFSNGVSVLGTLSGSIIHADTQLRSSGSLIVEGNMSGATLQGAGLDSCNGSTQKLLYNPSTKKFECGTDLSAVGNGSGSILSLHPEYPNAVYTASGTAIVGQLTATGAASANLENVYRWTSTKSAIQDYWIAVRVRLPNNFSSWDPIKPIEFRYRTSDATVGNNHLTVRMKDTAGANVSLSGGSGLANSSYTTATITGPESAGTWTAKGYFTVYIKVAAKTGGFAEAGFFNLNFETTTP